MLRYTFALLLVGCGAGSPCLRATAAGESYCAIACPQGIAAAIACPPDLPHRTEAPGIAVCRADEGPLTPEICEQLPNGCEPATEAPPLDEWRASLSDLGVELVECENGELGLRWPGPLPDEPMETAPASVMQIEGVIGAGIGGCCALSTERPGTPCLRIQYLRHATDPVELARSLASLRTADVGFAVHLDASGLAGPRCREESPFCLPEEYEGCAATTYRAGATRHPYDLGHAGGECRHDGECIQAGCGNDCVAWTLGGGAGTCEGYTLDHPVYCGCVEGRCQWFAQ